MWNRRCRGSWISSIRDSHEGKYEEVVLQFGSEDKGGKEAESMKCE